MQIKSGIRRKLIEMDIIQLALLGTGENNCKVVPPSDRREEEEEEEGIHCVIKTATEANT